jgi:UDP-N-acetylmuramate: L-alanyl-gamma-D-glutamyl-meso-diaminopimelate ligase
MKEYNGVMDKADIAVVFYSKHALSLKRMPDLHKTEVEQGFNKTGLLVITDKKELEEWLRQQSFVNVNLLLMSSGNYDDLDMLTFAKQIAR